MSMIQSAWQCGHVGQDEVCWRCTADIAMARHKRMREHMEFIRRGIGSVEPAQVADCALEEYTRFDDCVQGRHYFIDVTCVGDAIPRHLPCSYCGAKGAE